MVRSRLACASTEAYREHGEARQLAVPEGMEHRDSKAGVQRGAHDDRERGVLLV